jgi:4-amino-4-deoxy-L-arabinose transferase-like glycosyltransferase
MNKKYLKIFLVFILIISSFFRLYKIGEIPTGLYSDEVINGYDAYSFLKTGKDSHGENYVMFRARGDWREPVFHYTVAIIFSFLDVSESSLRITSAIYATLTLIVTYFLAKEMFDEKVGTFALFFLAFSPWLFTYSRIGFRAITLPFFFVLGLLFLIKGIKTKKEKYFCLASVVFGLNFYTYTTAYLFVPIFLLGFFLIYHKKLWKLKSKLILPIILFFITVAPLIQFYLNHSDWMLARFNQISIFNLEYTKNLREEIAKKFPILENNEILMNVGLFLQGYIKHYSIDFLFLNGDSNYRHSPKGFGQLYMFMLALVFSGLIVCMKNRKLEYKLLLYWFVIFPAPVALTIECLPHATRTIDAIPLFEIISAISFCLALDKMWKNRKLRNKKILLFSFTTLIFLVYAVNAGAFINHYFNEYPKYSAMAFGSRLGNAIVYANSIKEKYDKVVIINTFFGDLAYYISFYTKFDPILFQTQRLDINYGSIDDFCYDVNYKNCNGSVNSLYVVEAAKNLNQEPKMIFFNPDGSIAFRVFENITEI